MLTLFISWQNSSSHDCELSLECDKHEPLSSLFQKIQNEIKIAKFQLWLGDLKRPNLPRYDLSQFEQGFPIHKILCNYANLYLIVTDEEKQLPLATSTFASCLSKNPIKELLLEPLKSHTFSDLWKIEEFLTPQECQSLIDRSEAKGYELTDYEPSYRSNTRLIMFDHDLANILWERLSPFLPQELQDIADQKWKLIGLNPCFRYCKYEAGQFFKKHTDNNFVKNEEEQSLYTVNIYLNQSDHGGRTRFYDREGKVALAVEPQPGLCVIWDHLRQSHLHDGEVVSQVKYLLRTDVMIKRVKE